MWINTELSGCIKGHDYSQEMTLGAFVRSIKSEDVVLFPSLFIPFPSLSPFLSFGRLLISKLPWDFLGTKCVMPPVTLHSQLVLVNLYISMRAKLASPMSIIPFPPFTSIPQTAFTQTIDYEVGEN